MPPREGGKQNQKLMFDGNAVTGARCRFRSFNIFETAFPCPTENPRKVTGAFGRSVEASGLGLFLAEARTYDVE